jgi:hypothetical protein
MKERKKENNKETKKEDPPKKPGTTTAERSVCSAKVLDLFLRCPILLLVLGILGFGRVHAAPLVRELGGEIAGGVFFPLSLVLRAVHYKQEL